jgi:3-deoxy-D-manno-octulosonic-acid transferase
MYILYSLLLAMALLISLPWWVLQVLRLGKYRAGLRERLGFAPWRLRRVPHSDSIWIHAVSVGEVLAVSHLIAELQKANPGTQVYLSTTTATGQRLARERYGEDRVFFMPLDFGFAVRAYLNAVRPRLLILAETEFWPNLLHRAKQHGAAVAIVNARISDRSLPRYRRFRWFFRRILGDVDLFLAQTEADAERLQAIGAPAERVHVSGNLKFDIRAAAGSALAEDLRRARGSDRHVIVCGSTTEGEEEQLLEAFQQILQQLPSATMILAPRHPERFERVAGLVGASGIPLVRRSTWSSSERLSGRVLLLDSVGELAGLYALADVAFVGGSLLPGVGGHNILEPAQYAVPILVGPNTFNFREIVRLFERSGAITTVTTGNLPGMLLQLLGDTNERQRLGQRARELFLQNTGATARTLAALQPLLRENPVQVP